MELAKRSAPDEEAGSALVEAKRARIDADPTGSRRSIPVAEGPRRTSGLFAPTMLLTGHSDAVLGVDFSPSGEHLASCSSGGALFVWEVFGECRNVGALPRAHARAATAARWALGGDALVTCGAEGRVKLWDAERLAPIRSWSGHGRRVVNAVAAARGAAGVVRERDAKEEEEEGGGGAAAPGSASSSSSPVLPAPPLVFSGGDDRRARLWDARVARRAAATVRERFEVLAVDLSPDGRELWTGGVDGVVRGYDARNPSRPKLELKGHGEAVTGLALAPAPLVRRTREDAERDRERAAELGASKRKARNGGDPGPDAADAASSLASALSPLLATPSVSLASNGADDVVRVWDARPFAPPQRCAGVLPGAAHGHAQPLLRVAWSPDAARLAAGGDDGCVDVWSARDRALLYKLPGHKGTVYDVAFHPTQPIIASGGGDHVIFMGELAE